MKKMKKKTTNNKIKHHTMNGNGTKKNHEIFEMCVCVHFSVLMCARALQLAGAVVLKANIYLFVIGMLCVLLFFRI